MYLIKTSTILSLILTSACAGSQSAPTNTSTSSAAQSQEAPAAAEKSIVATAIDAGQFNTLVAAIKAAGLVDALEGSGPFTVFAPTDEAFAKLPPGTVEALLEDKENLAQILTYHVVSGKVMAADVGALNSAKTLQGQDVAIDTSNGVQIGGANVIATDIVATNGVVHVIDTVMIPQ